MHACSLICIIHSFVKLICKWRAHFAIKFFKYFIKIFAFFLLFFLLLLCRENGFYFCCMDFLKIITICKIDKKYKMSEFHNYKFNSNSSFYSVFNSIIYFSFSFSFYLFSLMGKIFFFLFYFKYFQICNHLTNITAQLY